MRFLRLEDQHLGTVVMTSQLQLLRMHDETTAFLMMYHRNKEPKVAEQSTDPLSDAGDFSGAQTFICFEICLKLMETSTRATS